MKQPNDDRLREEFASSGKVGATARTCPQDPEKIMRAAQGALNPGRVQELIEHSIECADCASDWRLASAVIEEVGDSLPHDRVREAARAPAGGRWWPALGLAGATLGVILVSVFLFREPAPPAPPYRTTDETTVSSLPPNDQVLPRDGFLLRWSAGPEGTLYVVEVATADLALLHRSAELRAQGYQVPEGALRPVPSGGTVLWRVEATFPSGARLDSMVFRVRLE